MRVRKRLRPWRSTLTAASAAVLLIAARPLGLFISGAALLDLALGMWGTGPLARRVVRKAAR